MVQTLFESFYKEVLPFWNDISKSDREIICQNSFDTVYPKGTNIHDGNECSGVIFVRSGSLRLYIMSESGKDITLYRLHKGDMCMLSASCVLKTITFRRFCRRRGGQRMLCDKRQFFCRGFLPKSADEDIRSRNRRKPIFRCDVGNATDTFYEHRQTSCGFSFGRIGENKFGYYHAYA